MSSSSWNNLWASVTVAVFCLMFLGLVGLAVSNCAGSRENPCYGNRTCDPGLTCVHLVGHGTSCATDEDLRVYGRDGTLRFPLKEGRR